MIHIVTVHWHDDRWVDVQLANLQRNVGAPFRVYAFLNSLPADHRHKFYYASTENIQSHAVKLNLLADMVTFNSHADDDWLIFLDGDAFPIRDIIAYGREKLSRHPLVAIQRLENAGDIQPHPSFCLTTIGFWKAIAGDWKEGFQWRDQRGEMVTDVGGNLLRILQDKQIDWHAMQRSNATNWHPLWFGLYDDLVYHHGAGFRLPYSRIDELLALNDVAALPFRQRLYHRFYTALPKRVAWRLRAPFDLALPRADQNAALSEKVFRVIERDPEFWRHLDEGGPRSAPLLDAALPNFSL